MTMSMILAMMADVRQRVLLEHVPDGYGRCWECRDSAGVAAAWPCDTRRIAEEAEWMARSDGRHASADGLDWSRFELRTV